jgi:hypothetical protein
MILTIFDIVTFKFSKILETVFDAIEYRLALRAFRHAARTGAKERSRTNVANTIPATRVSNPVSASAALRLEDVISAPFSGV